METRPVVSLCWISSPLLIGSGREHGLVEMGQFLPSAEPNRDRFGSGCLAGSGCVTRELRGSVEIGGFPFILHLLLNISKKRDSLKTQQPPSVDFQPSLSPPYHR
ncbi:hypothetical protein V6N13_033750 [Hibiscus sabdariffa]